MTAEWIPRTKFIPPLLPQGMLQRPSLVTSLYQAALTKRLTLISAQAGAGKTTLAAALSAVYPKLPLAWLSLDSADDDPLTFLTLLLTAVQDLLPDCHIIAAGLISAPEADIDPLRVVGIFINDILNCNPEPFLLVLDDLHALNNKRIFEMLDYFLEHLPPAMHLLVLTRHDPPLSLSRLRARGQLSELRMDKLQFNSNETRELLRQVLGFELNEKQLALLENRTEGWVAALRLLALSISDLSESEREQFLIGFVDSTQFIFDYLADEVLRRQSNDMRHFLLRTAILEELTPELCTAVTGNANAPALLHETYRLNLFLTRCREIAGPAAYRYHALFRRFLLSELQLRHGHEISSLHLRAAQALRNTPQAIRHCLEGGLWQEAAEHMEVLAREQFNRSYINPRFELWLEKLPPNVKQERPLLQLMAGRLLIQYGQLQDALPTLEQAATGFKACGDVRGELNALMYLAQTKPGNDATYFPAINHIMTAHPQIVSPSEEATYHMALMWGAIYTQHWAEASSHLQQLAAVALANKDSGPFQIISLAMTSPLFFLDDGLPIVQTIVAAMGERFAHDEGLLRLGRLAGEGLIALYSGQIENAESKARDALALSRIFGRTAWVELSVHQVLANALLAQGMFAALDSYLRSTLSHMAEVESMHVRRADVLGLLAQSLWNQDAVDELANTHQALAQSAIFDDQKVQVEVTAGMLAFGDGDLNLAVEHLHKAVDMQHKARLMNNADAGMVLAQILWYGGNQEAALREAGAALGYWQGRDMPGIILFSGPKSVPLLKAAVDAGINVETAQYCLNQLLDGAGPHPIPIPGSNEVLTPREVEVLGLIKAGMSNRAIANELVVSERTVKTHVTHILAKLQVRSRTQAVSRIRELGLPL